MARITVEDCLKKIDSQYDLVLLAKERTSQLNAGDQPLVDKDNDKNTVISLREIGDGAITYDDLKERYLKSLQKVVINNEEDEENDIEEEFSSYLSQEDNDKSLNPNSFFKNTEDSFEDVSDELIRKEE